MVTTMTSNLPIPGIGHGARNILNVIDERADRDPQSPWVAVPIDETDLSKGYKDIDFGAFANAVNHATHWMRKHLPESNEKFDTFAYAGPRDLRYPILAAAAGKLEKVVSDVSLILQPSIWYHQEDLACPRIG